MFILAYALYASVTLDFKTISIKFPNYKEDQSHGTLSNSTR